LPYYGSWGASPGAPVTSYPTAPAAPSEPLAGRSARNGVLLEIARPAAARRPQALDLLLDGFTIRLTRGHQAAAPLLRTAVDLVIAGPAAADPTRRLAAMSCWAARELLDDQAQHALASRWVRADREQGALFTLPLALGVLAESETLAGRFGAAETHLDEARGVARATGLLGVAGFAGFADLLVLAWRGREAEARSAFADRTAVWSDGGLGAGLGPGQRALAILELGAGRYDAALARVLTVYRDDPPGLGTAVLPDLVEAAARAGDHAAATAALDRLSERAAASGTDLALGLLARSRALLSRDGQAETLHAEAVERLRGTRAAAELARAHLVYGEWLRRQRRRRDAREQLRTAHDMLEAMGAEGFAARARVELQATGERVSKRTGATPDQLTAQETQVARLVAEGLSNREIAAQLFLSPNTIEYHLQKVFRKLQVRSRTQLARALLG
jgi:DNA-binding CsgD family transcriptional regulator